MDNEYIEKEQKEAIKKIRKAPRKTSKKTTSTKKKSTKKANSDGFSFKKMIDRYNKKKIKTILGATLLFLGVILFLANFSYLLTWQGDQNRVLGKGFFEFIFDGNPEPVRNWIGKLGAWSSHLLIYRSFGISSFLIPFMLIVVGIKWMFNFSILPVRKTLKVGTLLTVVGSLFFGFFSEKVSYLGGIFGYQMNHWLWLTIGKIATFVLIAIIVYLVATLSFGLNFKKIKAFFQKSDEEVDENLSEVNDENDLVAVNQVKENELKEEVVAPKVDLNKKEPEIIEPVQENELTITPTELTKEEEIIKSEIIEEIESSDDFKVEVATEKEDETLSEKEMNSLEKEFGEYDPKLDLSSYTLPGLDLLTQYDKGNVEVNKSELEANKNKIVETLQNYKIEISKIMATIGPTVTLYEIVPAPGIRISKIKNLEDDIALSLAALGIRIIAPIPGKGTIGIEVPNSKPEMVSMRSLIASKKFQESKFELPVVMGKTITNETFTFDLTKMPHLLVAGATGQGKSVGLNAILVSILYKKHPAQVKFVLVDPKKVELTLYNKIERHFLAKLPDEEDAIITDTSKVVNTLNSLCIEMDDRYELLKTAQVRTIKEYNAKFVARKLNPENGHRYLPYIVVLIDEFADLIMTAGKEVEHPIARLAQLARAIGIHLIVATQRPSVNVITGMIKANFPARIAFRVLSKIDSRTILDGSGADQLIGRGDMLISTGSDTIRLQCGFVDTPEVEAICDFIGDQRGYPDALLLPEYVGEGSEGKTMDDDEDLDALFADAARIVVMHQQGSASLLQRKLKLGYNRAGRIVDQLEAMGIIGPFKGSKARDVLYADEVQLEEFLASKGIV